MTITLFPEPSEARTSPLGGAEPVVHWLTESTRDEAKASRRVVNHWYREFPDDSSQLSARLRSESDTEHLQAIDELFMHNLLRRRQHDVRYEEHGTGPDFRIYRSDALAAGIEVLSIFQRQDWTDQQRLHYRLSDEINKRIAPTAGYFVDLTIERAEREPAPRRFTSWVRARIAELPPHDQLALSSDAGWADLPCAVYERSGVRIRVMFLPMRKDAPAKSNPDARIAGTGPMIGGMVNSGARLKDRIEAKAGGRYDLGGQPFLVAVGVHDTFCDLDEINTALYGPDVVDIQTGRLVRTPTGLFRNSSHTGSWSNRRLSAVAILSDLRLWEPAATNTIILHNPGAASKWPDGVLPATRQIGGGGAGRDD